MALEPIQTRTPLVDRAGLVTGAWARWFTALWTQVNRVQAGTGTPEGAVAAPIGTLYLRNDGPPALYVKEAGTATDTTGWVAK
jgi:hypothetical protein